MLHLLNIYPQRFKDYWCETGNQEELRVAAVARTNGKVNAVWVEKEPGKYVEVTNERLWF